MTYAVLVYPTAITGVSLNGINDTVFDFLDNAGVVGLSILRTRRTLVSLVVLRGWSVRKGTVGNILRVPIGCHALPADEESGCNAPVL